MSYCEINKPSLGAVAVDFWLQEKDRLIVRLIDLPPTKTSALFDVSLSLSSGRRELYDYLPFSFMVSADAPQSEIGEIDRHDQPISITVKHVLPNASGELVLDFRSELAGCPQRLDLGADARHLSLHLNGVMTRCSDDLVVSPHYRRDVELGASATSRDRAAIFIVGSGRNGSSILTWALGQHPNISPIEETNFLPLLLSGAEASYKVAALPERGAVREYNLSVDSYLGFIGDAVTDMLRTTMRSMVRRDFLKRISCPTTNFDDRFQRLRTRWSPKCRWVDGTPLNIVALPLLARAFVESQFIALIREPLQVISSYVTFCNTGGDTYTVEKAANTWLDSVKMILWTQEILEPRRFTIVHFDELSDPDVLVRRLLGFLNEPNCSSCLKPFERKINSSDKNNLVEFDLTGPLVEQCSALYSEIRAGKTWRTVKAFDTATCNFDAWQNDLSYRLVRCMS